MSDDRGLKQIIEDKRQEEQINKIQEQVEALQKAMSEPWNTQPLIKKAPYISPFPNTRKTNVVVDALIEEINKGRTINFVAGKNGHIKIEVLEMIDDVVNEVSQEVDITELLSSNLPGPILARDI